MTSQEKKQLSIFACKVRMGIIASTHAAKCGHPGGSMSAADMLTYLYNKEMNVDPQNPKWEERDRFVLSKGHAAPGLYATLAHRGFFPVEDLLTLRKLKNHHLKILKMFLMIQHKLFTLMLPTGILL